MKEYCLIKVGIHTSNIMPKIIPLKWNCSINLYLLTINYLSNETVRTFKVNASEL